MKTKSLSITQAPHLSCQAKSCCSPETGQTSIALCLFLSQNYVCLSKLSKYRKLSCYVTKNYLKARDKAQQARMLAMQAWGPEFGFKYSCKKLGMDLHLPIIPRFWEGVRGGDRVEGSMEFAGC